jgi:hypothetical protein
VDDPDNFETWEKLVRAAESLEGGINRNSNPQAITTVRNSFDRFLAKFPLLFGYWKKYADLEFSITGTEAAEMVCVLRSALPISLRSPRAHLGVADCLLLVGLRKRCRQYFPLR